MQRHWSTRPHPHRWLGYKPGMPMGAQRGDDVQALQADANARLEWRGLDDYVIHPSGVAGPRTFEAVRQSLYYLGGPLGAIDLLDPARYRDADLMVRINPTWQYMIREPRRRNAEQLRRARHRRDAEPLPVREVSEAEPGKSILVVRSSQIGIPPPGRNPGSLRITRMAIDHHTAGAHPITRDGGFQECRNIDRYHRNVLGWVAAGYHECITPFGDLVWMPRGEMMVLGAHTANENTGTYGMCVIGNFHGVNQPTTAALTTLHARFTQPPPLAGMPDLRPFRRSQLGHREIRGQSTACPGDSLLPHIRRIRA